MKTKIGAGCYERGLALEEVTALAAKIGEKYPQGEQVGTWMTEQVEGFKMTCMRCGREVYISTTPEAIEIESGVLVIRNIPCYKCDECDEIIYTGDVASKIEGITEMVKKFTQEVTIIDYNKVA